jgi:membrane complex biogenesis BtpA family protein
MLETVTAQRFARPARCARLEAEDGTVDALARIFSRSRPIIGMVHLPASPGQPRHRSERSLRDVVDAVARDIDALEEGGIDGVMYCNEADLPYATAVGPEVPAYMASIIAATRERLSVPFGVNVLWDPFASLAVASATGASWVREVLTGVFETDMGMLEPDPAAIFAYRARLGISDCALFANVAPEFARSVAGRDVASRARGAAYFGCDALLISGPMAGVAFDLAELREAREAVPFVPVIANTGVTVDNVAETLRWADGAIVGSSLKVDGNVWNPVDASRVRRLTEAADRVRVDPAAAARAPATAG